ncbi:MAG: type I secretion C-terminal target domain-containing protein, partial [Pseudomonadota bacterium]
RTTGDLDTITDFSLADGDVIDISALISAYDPANDDRSDYVRTTEVGGNTVIEIDAGGTGSAFENAIVITGVTGLDLDQMETNGNLITS